MQDFTILADSISLFLHFESVVHNEEFRLIDDNESARFSVSLLIFTPLTLSSLRYQKDSRESIYAHNAEVEYKVSEI